MTDAERELLAVASRLLEYPDARFFKNLPDYQSSLDEALAHTGEAGTSLLKLVEWLEETGSKQAQEHYVRVFDHDPGASLYLSWHRYGNDRGQGKAMAALNGLYRMAGFEPVPGILPDYVPRVLEFLAVCEDWAAEVLLDGFGPEIDKILKHLEETDSPYRMLFSGATAPLRKKWPDYFRPRNAPDRTLRPLARPEQEENLFTASRGQIPD